MTNKFLLVLTTLAFLTALTACSTTGTGSSNVASTGAASSGTVSSAGVTTNFAPLSVTTNVTSTTSLVTNSVINNFYASNTVITNITTVTNILTLSNLQTNSVTVAVLSNSNVVTVLAATTNYLGTNYAGGSAFSNTAGVVFNGIPAGSNWMGDTNQFTNRHMVTLTAFYMSRYETTYSAWTTVYDWATNHGYQFDAPGEDGYLPQTGNQALHPVVSNNWYDMVKWCNALSEMEGRTPCYYLDAAQTVVYTNGQSNIVNAMLKTNANGYRLPTEAEWEYACRAGTTSDYYWGDTTNGVENYAWYWVNSVNQTRQVGQKLPNSWELYDMIGNVWEWCWDYYVNSYSLTNERDPIGSGATTSKILRGNSWYEFGGLSSSYRLDMDYSWPDTYFGFRIVTRSAQ